MQQSGFRPRSAASQPKALERLHQRSMVADKPRMSARAALRNRHLHRRRAQERCDRGMAAGARRTPLASRLLWASAISRGHSRSPHASTRTRLSGTAFERQRPSGHRPTHQTSCDGSLGATQQRSWNCTVRRLIVCSHASSMRARTLLEATVGARADPKRGVQSPTLWCHGWPLDSRSRAECDYMSRELSTRRPPDVPSCAMRHAVRAGCERDAARRSGSRAHGIN